MIPLGSKVKDNLTGYEGIATARVTYLYGCVHIAVQSPDLKDGVPQRERLFDEQRIGIIERVEYEATEPQIQLGSIVRDKISGLTGVATVWVDELYGTPSIHITPKELHEGRPIEGISLPEDRVEVLQAQEPKISADSSATSGSIAEYARPNNVR
jgi:hypothetical protein